MFSSRRFLATLLIVTVLAAGFGLLPSPLVQNAAASDSDEPDCSDYINWCCGALKKAEKYCGSEHFDAAKCAWYQSVSFMACGAAAEECGYSVYHLCYEN